MSGILEALRGIGSEIGGSLFGGGSGASSGGDPTPSNSPYADLSPSQRRLLGVAALQDAFASLTGQQGTALQRISPVAEQIGWNEYVRGLSGGQAPGRPPQMQAPQAAMQPATTQPAAPQQAPQTPSTGFGREVIGRALDRLGSAESNNNPTAVNRLGYAGQYQLGAPLAADARIYRPAQGEINERGQWNGQWGGTFNIPGFDNVRTLQDFLNSPEAQRRAAELSMNVQAGRLEQMGMLRNVGQEVNGVRITPEALLQGAWLGGPGGVDRFVRGGGQDRADAFGTPVSRWMRLGQGEAAAPGAAPQAPPSPQGAEPQQGGAPLTPAQAVLAGGAGNQPRITPEVAALLRQLGPQAGRQFLAQMQMRAMQQETRVLSEAEARNALGTAYDPDRRYQITSQGGIQPIAGTREPEGGSSQQQRELEGSLRSQFLGIQPVRDYFTMLPQIREVRAAASRETPSRINDINLVFAFAKMLDPASVVREGEQIQILRAQGLGESLTGAINRLNGGSGLTTETRSQLVREANSRFDSAQSVYQEFADQYRGLAQDYGVNPTRVVRPVGMGQTPEPQRAGGVPQGQQAEFVAAIRERLNLPPGNPQRLTIEQAIAGATAAGIPNAAALFGAR